MSGDLLKSALFFASRGFAVFPLMAQSKEPYPGTRGLLDASSDPEQIRRWWGIAPDSNVGVRPPPGVVVVDVDPRNEGDKTIAALEAKHGAFPDTLTVRTGGGGLHAYYSVPAELSWPKELAEGIDLKASNGYLLAPPSIHDKTGRSYAWLSAPDTPIAPAPAWLVTVGYERQERVTIIDEDDAPTQSSAEVEAMAGRLAPLFGSGKKHGIAFAVGGWLRQRGWNQGDIAAVVERLPSTNPRARVKDALDGFRAQNDHGWSSLRGLLGEASAAQLDAATPNPRRDAKRRENEEAKELLTSAMTPARVAMLPTASALPLPPPVANANVASGSPTDAKPKKPSSRQVTTADVVDVLGSGVWAGVLAYDALANRVVCLLEPPMRTQDNPGVSCIGEWTDAHTARARTWIFQALGREPGKDATDAAVEIVARRRAFHPVQSYLASLRWDGSPRIDNVLTRYFGADANAYTTRVGSKTMIAAVARALQPGCKVDTMAILEGTQGIGKSRGVRALAGDHWFADTPLDLESKDAAQCLQGKWIYEIGELHSFNRTETTRIKAFVSSQSDNLRPSYGRRNQDFPRQCVFIGTTNGTEYLTDTTGNRRYWPVKCRAVDVAGLERDRDQLWAEAYARYYQGEHWWLEGAEVALAEAQQADREAVDPWEQPIAAWLANANANANAPRAPFTMGDVLRQALGLSAPEQTPANATRVGKLLAKLGWRSKKVRDANDSTKLTRIYVQEAA